MHARAGKRASEVWHASADTIIANLAGGLVLLVFYPITLCAAGVKGLARIVRPHLLSHRSRHVTSTN
jgi:hypothetical protein